jgi:hypothetical protein
MGVRFSEIKTSMGSAWVETEIRRARKRERAEGRQVLFPIRLAEMDAIKEWQCFDSDSGEDLANKIRDFYIPDFSHWRDDPASFDREFDKLLRDLKQSAEEPPA